MLPAPETSLVAPVSGGAGSEAVDAQRPLKIGLTKNAKRLVQIRQQRLEINGQHEETDYVDLDSVTNEIKEATQLYKKHGWEIIDVSKNLGINNPRNMNKKIRKTHKGLR